MSVSTQKGGGTFLTLHRIEALTDGVFAIVMTLLVLDISIPLIAHSSLQVELPRRLIELWPKFYSYVLSFIVLGMFWSNHHFAFHHIKRSNNGLVWINIFFLMFVALIPFTTSLIGDYRMEQLPFVIYVINVLLILIMRLILWTYATGKYRLVDSDINPRLVKGRKLSMIVTSLILILAIGISFINVAAAFSVLALMLVYGVVAQYIIKTVIE